MVDIHPFWKEKKNKSPTVGDLRRSPTVALTHFNEAYYKEKIDKCLCKHSSVDKNIAVWKVRCSNLDFLFIYHKE